MATKCIRPYFVGLLIFILVFGGSISLEAAESKTADNRDKLKTGDLIQGELVTVFSESDNKSKPKEQYYLRQNDRHILLFGNIAKEIELRGLQTGTILDIRVSKVNRAYRTPKNFKTANNFKIDGEIKSITTPEIGRAHV